MGKTIVGLSENIKIIKNGSNKYIAVKAKIDSGADRCSIDKSLVKKLKLGPFVGRKIIKSTHGKKKRHLVYVRIKIKDRKFKARFNIADRNHMKYKVLIGKNILRKGFLIDPSRV